MPEYHVPIVRREQLGLWHDYWDSKKPSRKAKRANRDASLGRTVTVKAKNKIEAAQKAEKLNPGCVAIRDAIARLPS